MGGGGGRWNLNTLMFTETKDGIVSLQYLSLSTALASITIQQFHPMLVLNE